MDIIKIMIVDDHAVVRQGLRQLIDAQPDIEVVAESADGEMAVQTARSITLDVILMDLLMPVMDGITAIKKIREAGVQCGIIALTSSMDEQLIKDALQSGAQGYLLKASRVNDVIDAIKKVANGQNALDPAALQVIMQQSFKHEPIDTLTTREREVFDLMAHGKTNPEIANTLSISEITVRTHIASVLEKLQLRDRTQVVIYALKKGLVRVDDLPN